MSKRDITATLDDTEVIEPQLATLAQLTEMMRQHQASITDLGRKRARIVEELRAMEQPVPFRMLAEAMGVTEQAIYQMLRKHRQHQ